MPAKPKTVQTESLKMTYKSIDELKPYSGNVKNHPKKQIEQIADSIRKFGFNDPIGITADGTIIEGHGRYEAAKALGLAEVPTIDLSHLTEDERKAYTIVHNKLTMNTGFDLKKLQKEMASIGKMPAFDFKQFGINDGFLKGIDHKANTKESTMNILNLGYAQFPGVGKWDIPQIEPVQELPEGITEWIGFNYVLSDKEPENKAIHFFVDDYQFERVWNQPDKYIPYLQRYKCVLSPDFSPYGDMPLITQMFNHYRKHWIAAYWQSKGLTVIPTIRSSTDSRFLPYFLDGEPKGGVVAYDTKWEGSIDLSGVHKQEWLKMIKTLKPSLVIVYGSILPTMQASGVELVEIPKFTDKRWSLNSD